MNVKNILYYINIIYTNYIYIIYIYIYIYIFSIDDIDVNKILVFKKEP